MESCYPFKGQSLENGLSYMFQAIGSILNTKAKQQNTKVKVKETFNMESDLFFSSIEGLMCPEHKENK